MLPKRSVKWLIAIAMAYISLLPVPVAFAQPVTTVHLNGQATGSLPAPCNCLASVDVVVNAQGSPASLEGSGINHSSTGSKNHFSVTGSVEGSVVLLSGTVADSNVPYLLGSQIEINADEETGAFQFTIVPSGGPFAGQVLVFAGSANIVITGD